MYSLCCTAETDTAVQRNYAPIGASLVAQLVKNLSAVLETQVQSLGWEDSLGGGMAICLKYCCLENSMDRGSWWATVYGVAQSRTQLKHLTGPPA